MAWVSTFGARKKVIVSGWSMLSSPAAAELLAASLPYDAMTLDLQHGMGGSEGLYAWLQALGGSQIGRGVVPLVRAAENNAHHVGYALDAGVRGIIMPMVNCPADAEQFVSACRHFPEGTRSWGPMRAGLMAKLAEEARAGSGGDGGSGDSGGGGGGTADPHEAVEMAMIETREGLDAAEAIAATPGIDALFVGPFDLGMAIGAQNPGVVLEAGDVAPDPLLLEAVRHVQRAAHAHGKRAAIFCGDGASALAMARGQFDDGKGGAAGDGFDLVVPGHDALHITRGAAADMAPLHVLQG